jgi:septation ring formation regulator EzrA
MRHRTLALVAAAFAPLWAAEGVWAQSAAPSPQIEAATEQRDQDAKHETFFDPEKEVRHYDHHLTLNEDQKARVLKIMRRLLEAYKKNADQREEIRRKTQALTNEILEYRKNLKRAMDDLEAQRLKSRSEIRDLLDPSQTKAFDEMESRSDLERRESQSRDQEAAEQEHRESGQDASGR